jgi:hypothetical protein
MQRKDRGHPDSFRLSQAALCEHSVYHLRQLAALRGPARPRRG